MGFFGNTAGFAGFFSRSGFDPAKLPNILFWGDVELGTEQVSGDIDTLTNQLNPGTYDAIAPAAGQRPAYTASGIGGKPGAMFTAADTDTLNSATGFPDTGPYWKVALHAPTNVPTAFSGNIYSSSAGPAFWLDSGYQFNVYHGANVATAKSYAFNNIPMVSVAQWDGTTAEVYHNGLKVGSGASASRGSGTDFALGTFGEASGYSGTGMIWMHGSGTLTQTQINQVTNYLWSRVGLVPEHFIFDGDSMTTPDYTNVFNCMPSNFQRLLPADIIPTIYNDSVSSQTLLDMEAQAVTTIDPLNFGAAHTRRTFIIWGGTNDIAGGASASTTFDRLKTYLTNRLAANSYDRVAVITSAPRADATMTTTLFEYNNLIRTHWNELEAIGATHLVDIQTLPEFDSATDLADTDIFLGDSIHLTGAGNAKVAQLLRDVLGYTNGAASPETIGSLRLWVKADAGITESGGAVSNWANQASTGSGYDFAQATAGNRPTLVSNSLNGLPGIQFDGVNDRLELSSTGLSLLQNVGGVTAFAVWKSADTGSNQVLFSVSDNASPGWVGRFYLEKNGTGNVISLGGNRTDGGAMKSISELTGSGTDALITQATLDYASAAAYLRKNGYVSKQDTSFLDAGNTSNTTSAWVALGYYKPSANSFLNGTVYELIVYNRALSLREREQVQNYLAERWGISTSLA